MILLAHIFETSHGQIIVGMTRSTYTFTFPCSFDLFNGGKKVTTVVAKSMVLDNNSIVMTMKGIVDEDYSRISLTLNDGIDRFLVEGRHNAYLLQSGL